MELAQSEEMIKLIMNSALDAIIGMDSSGVIIIWTIQAEKLFGWNEKEVKGKMLSDIIIPERYRERHKSGMKRYLESHESKVLNKIMELEGLRRDGSEFSVEITIVSIKQNDSEFFCAFLRDISERKKVEAELRESELRYRSLIEQASDAIMITDFNGNFIDVNESLCVLSGYSKMELLQMNAKDLIDPEQLKVWPIAFDRALAGEHIRSERRMLHKSGSIVDIDANGKKINDDLFLIIARDITEEKKMQELLIERGEQLELFIEHSPASLAMLDNEMRYIATSRRWVTDYNLEGKELIGKTHYEIFPEIPQHWKDIHQRCLKGAIEKNEEDSFTREDGTKDWLRWEIRPWHKASGEIGGIIMFTEVINERKKAEEQIVKSEQRYRSLIEQASDPIMITDFNGNFVVVNESMCNMFGYRKEQLLNMNISALIDPEELKMKPMSFDREVAGQHLFSERRMMHMNGEIIDVEANVKKVGDNQLLAIARNVTERKKVQSELQKSHEQLRQLSAHLETIREEERTNIAREIHDELGQQLTGLKMDLSSLVKKINPENESAHKKAASMMALLDTTMKTVRHISAELRPGILDDLGLVDAINWHGIEFEKRTGVRCQFKSKLKKRVFEKDLSTGIFRVYQETLTNVARHANATKVTTTLEATNENIILKVQDNGKGFEQSEVKSNNTLGLVGMRERAIMFGGKITIESEKGKGTIVTLQVPLKIAPGQIV